MDGPRTSALVLYSERQRPDQRACVYHASGILERAENGVIPQSKHHAGHHENALQPTNLKNWNNYEYVFNSSGPPIT